MRTLAEAGERGVIRRDREPCLEEGVEEDEKDEVGEYGEQCCRKVRSRRSK